MLIVTMPVALALSVAARGQTAEEACQPYDGVHRVGDDEGTCNGRIDGDRVRIENDGDGSGWQVDDVD